MRCWLVGGLLLAGLSGCDGTENLLAGSWQSCNPIHETFVKYTTTQGDGKWHDSFVEYNDAECTEKTEIGLHHQAQGTYHLGDKVSLNDVDNSPWDVYELTVIEGDAGVVRECFTLVSIQNDVMYYGVIDQDNDCTSLQKRSKRLDLSHAMVRKAADVEVTSAPEPVPVDVLADMPAEG